MGGSIACVLGHHSQQQRDHGRGAAPGGATGGAPVWVGRADHLDVVGYFRGRGGHRDWLSRGARFGAARFATLMDRIVDGMLEGERTRDAAPG